jgi:dTDP-glucose 4,6-dehydratase
VRVTICPRRSSSPAEGFVGSKFVRYVRRHTAWHVVVVDKLTYAGNLASLHDVEETTSWRPRHTFARSDIADGASSEGVRARSTTSAGTPSVRT